MLEKELRIAPGQKENGQEVKVEWEYLKNHYLSKSEIRGTERKLWRNKVGVVLKVPAILTRHLFCVFYNKKITCGPQRFITKMQREAESII